MSEPDHGRLALVMAEAAVQEADELRDELEQHCPHYGPPLRYKFDGGRCPIVCGLCSRIIGRWWKSDDGAVQSSITD